MTKVSAWPGQKLPRQQRAGLVRSRIPLLLQGSGSEEAAAQKMGGQIRTWDRSIGGSIPKGKHSGENKTQRQRHGEVIGLKFTH